MLYIEHPAPVGFSQGKPTINSEVDVAGSVFGFLQHFLEVGYQSQPLTGVFSLAELN